MASNNTKCLFAGKGILSLIGTYFYRMFFNIGAVASFKTAIDSTFELFFITIMYVLSLYTRSYFLGALYFKFRSKIRYQYFVRNITNYYVKQNIHPDLMARLQRYLRCHWKYFSGVDITHPNPLKGEAFVIYWKCHGETAVRIISESEILKGADPALVRELAQKAKILLIPKRAAVLLFGIQTCRINWLLEGVLRCEYQSDANETIVNYVQPGKVLSALTVLYSGTSIQTFTAASDCEILYITRSDFFETIRRYPLEASFFENTLKEMEPEYTAVVNDYVQRNRERRYTSSHLSAD
ncbi:uncharacterized protein LOC113235920 [Hyposmocoma kahamanoa]|uniref:uncharacterized protein LOC113235920 n=1 Tax=Hyposmocoma kahamanoa TaxID=1477025 RepID=UPI000E6D6D46|nr:uncharacterized protein LOC113235920 [Hyposmocoma kahamanoa]